MLRFAVLAVLIVSALVAPTTARAITLGMADDPTLVRSGQPDALLDAGQQRYGVSVVRVIASADRDRGQYLALAQNLKARGMTMIVTLDLPFGDRGDQSPAEFAQWAAGMTADLQATGVDLRVGLLNEPDILLPAAGVCQPDAVSRIVQSSKAATSTVKRRVRVAKTRRVRRALRRHGRVVRRHGRAVMVTVRVPVLRRVKVRKRVHGRVVTSWRAVPVFGWQMRTVTVAGEPVESSDTVTDLTPRRECFAIVRARRAAEFLRAAIPAVRAAAPGVRVEIGDTSPTAGVLTFVGELAAQGLPAIDGWADHPYGLGQASATAAAVRAGFGSVPLDWTEFGSPHANGDAAGAAAFAAAGRLASSLGVRLLVAYQWQTEPGARWDTSLQDDGLSDTGRAQAFASLR